MRCAIVAENIIRRRGGKRALRRLLEAFRRGDPANAVAVRFQVSPALVGRWRRALGWEAQRYVIHADIQALLRPDLALIQSDSSSS